MDFWGEDDLNDDFPDYSLKLTELQTCRIKSINRVINRNILCLESVKTDEQAICYVEGFWLNINLDVGDIINVTAIEVGGQWLINNDHGLLIYGPDLLISATSVAGSLWCKRKHVLAELFRGFEPQNEVMVIGTLVHMILQMCLQNSVTKQKDMEALIVDELNKPNNIRKFYECGVTKEHVQKKIEEFLPNIQEFLRQYVHCTTRNTEPISGNWNGVISSIDDIEENIWCPELGLKGKIDVTIKTDSHTLPLEVKTGKASFSLEHKGQVIMYIMMMKKMGYDVSSGLLLYIRENILREVQVTNKETRDIMILRNELCYYLTRKSKIGDENSLELKTFPPELPPPINHPACQKCAYRYVCTSYARYFEENLSPYKYLKNIQAELSQDISDAHLNYIMKWITLLDIEYNFNNASRDLIQVYTQTPEQRESRGRCIRNLKVVRIESDNNGVHEYFFEKKNESDVSLYSNSIGEGNYVLISTDKRTAIGAGFINSLTPTTVSVFLDRKLHSKYTDQAFHIDSYESASSKSFNLTSLSLLLEVSSKADKLRRIIIDKQQPTFRSTLPKVIAKVGRPILRKLNICQQKAVLKALAAKDYFLIKGMPGTGKTATLAALIQLLHELGKTILIASHTHSAVDNLCLKLVESGIKFMRLGSERRIDVKLKEYSEHNLTKHCRTPNELEEVYNNTQIFAVTCLGSGHSLLSKRSLDICIIDESTQVLQCSLIRPIYATETFILIGDPQQLNAVVRDKQAKDLGMSESLFERLYEEKYSAVMNLNYRMNSRITALANETTYKGELLTGNEDVASATITVPNKQFFSDLKVGFQWITEALEESMENSVQFIDTGPVWNLHHDVPWRVKQKLTQNEIVDNEHENNLNIYEAAIVAKLVESLLKAGVKPIDIGVIATYRLQVAQISSLVDPNVDVNTVDQFQGKDKSIVIYSCSKSKDMLTVGKISKHELLEDNRRITVALTRAKHKLILIGDVETLNRYSTFKTIIRFLENNIIRLNKYSEFDWDFIKYIA